jgi:hypothetical protein
MSNNKLAALVMRERAAEMIETHVVETQYDGRRVVVPSNLAKEDQHQRSLAAAIRALPTTFTEAELLAAAAQLPEVRELVENAKRLVSWAEQTRASGDAGFWNWRDGDEYSNTLAALAPFMKGGE